MVVAVMDVNAENWPGNIRESHNVVERTVILSETDTFFVDESWLKLESPESLGSHAKGFRRCQIVK